MKTRRVYVVPDLEHARSAIVELRRIGLEAPDIALVARADIELESIPDELKEADTDLKPAALRGAGIGGATGLLAGLTAFAIPPLGVTLAGAAFMALTGAAIGSWAAALMGATVADPIRRKFEDEIAAGRLLLVVDAVPSMLDAERSAVEQHGGRALPYSAPKAIS